MNESEKRLKVIEQLEELKNKYQKRVSNPIYNGEEPRRKLNALDFAISSLKTDLKYDLMYEGEDIYTKDEVMAMLTELQKEIEEKATECCDDGWWLTYNNIIQEKIDKLS